MSISVVIYSYKNKNLVDIVQNIFNIAQVDTEVLVRDQHPLIHKNELEAISKSVTYKHQFWDFIESPCNLKKELIGLASKEYLAIITDDTVLLPGWDVALINFIKDKNIVVSGQGKLRLEYNKKYFIDKVFDQSDVFAVSNFIDRNLIFSKLDVFNKLIDYPENFKYFGEEEALSMMLFEKNIPVFSGPTILYKDLGVRRLENLYTPFSIEHNYNSIFEMMETVGAPWVKWHNIDLNKIKKIPYQKDDVPYNPYDLQFNKVEQERFIDSVNGIY